MTLTNQSYGPCPIKGSRRTKNEIDAIRTAIKDVLKTDHPQTVRQVFYQLVARDVIEKTEPEYKRTVIRLLSEMRLADQVPWDWIVDPVVERIALTKEQIQRYRLPTRPTKREGNPHARDFEGRSVELDALPSRILRQLVTDFIERHITADELEVLRAAEESERELIEQFAEQAEQEGA